MSFGAEHVQRSLQMLFYKCVSAFPLRGVDGEDPKDITTGLGEGSMTCKGEAEGFERQVSLSAESLLLSPADQ